MSIHVHRSSLFFDGDAGSIVIAYDVCPSKGQPVETPDNPAQFRNFAPIKITCDLDVE
jgi:hypothetical protein